VDADSYLADLIFVAHPRAPGTPHWQAVQDMCADRLTTLGFRIERHDYGSGVNVVGTLAGTDPDGPVVILSAHYDHIGDCPGADDNATGVAALLESARIAALAPLPGTLKVICWDEEERGLVGSSAYAARAEARGEAIDVLFAIDMIGYADDAPNTQTLPDNLDILFPAEVDQLAANAFRANFIPLAANAGARDAASLMAEYGAQMALLAVPLVLPQGLETHPLLAELRRSDHAPFWTAGYPAVLVSDTAELRNPNYHCRDGQDTLDTLDMEFAVKIVRALVATMTALLEPPG